MARLRVVLSGAGEPTVSRESITSAVKKVAAQKNNDPFALAREVADRKHTSFDAIAKKVLTAAHKKAKTNGKQKGKRAERELVQLFCSWWEKSTGTPNAFARTPDSGAFATRRRKLGQEEEQFQGDVYGPPECTLHIEAKHREGWSFDSFVSSPKELPKSFLSWWAQADRETPTNKTPILVFRKNHMPWMVARRGYLSMNVPGLIVHVDDMPLAIYPLSAWLEENNPHFYGAASAKEQP